MKLKVLSLGLAGILIGAGCGPRMSVKQKQATTVQETRKVESDYTGPKRRIAVIDFENKTAYGGRLGNTATDIMITELAKSGKFIMIERDKMNTLLEEQKLGMTGVINPNTAAKAGKILGLNAIVTGSVSQFGSKIEGSDYLITKTKRQIVEAVVDVRVVDVETGQILYADSGKGVVKKSTGKFLGMGTKSSYDETMEGEALRAAIVKFVQNIIYQINVKPWSCRVAQVDKSNIYLNAGFTSGLKIGTKLTVFHLGQEIIDPTTGVSMGNVEDEIAQIEVIRHFGEDGSVAKIKKGRQPSRNDICRLVE